MPANCSGGGVFETTRRFHAASAAFMRPARRPTRGSGLGATVDRFAPPEEAQAAREPNPIVSASDRSAGALQTTRLNGSHTARNRAIGRLKNERIAPSPRALEIGRP